MIDSIQIGKLAPNFVSVGIYKNRLGKIRLSDYYGKKYVLLVFYPANFTSVATTELIQLIANALNKSPKLFSIPGFIRLLIQKIKPAIFKRLFGSQELDNSNTNIMLGFEPPYSTEYGIREMVTWYKSNKNK